MSSTITQSELQTVPKAPSTAPMESKPKPELMRSASIEKIKKFNSFICSQNYYILPSLLAWLKTSQTVLQEAMEKTIFYFKYLILGIVLFKSKTKILTTLQVLLDELHRRFFVLVVYFSIGFIFLQLLVCAYLLCLVFLPAGFVFLMVCLYTVCHLYYRLNSSYIEVAERKLREGNKKRPTRPRKRDILKGRTISNFNVLG